MNSMVTAATSRLPAGVPLVFRPQEDLSFPLYHQWSSPEGEVPLIGGLAIFTSVLTLLPLFTPLTEGLLWYLAGAGLRVLFGVIDDRFNLGVSVRVAVEVVAALIMIFGADLWVGHLGNLLGFRDLHMPLWLAAPFTIIAVFGITNAWNMIDGMDGVAGTVTLMAMGGFYFLTHEGGGNNVLSGLLLGATAAFLLFNICNNRLLPKVFLGDAGSKLIGFTLVWLLIACVAGLINLVGGLLYAWGAPDWLLFAVFWLLTALYMTGIERTRLLARALLGQETGEQQHG